MGEKLKDLHRAATAITIAISGLAAMMFCIFAFGVVLIGVAKFYSQQ